MTVRGIHPAMSAMAPGSFRGQSVDLYVNSTCNLKCKTCFLGDDYFAKTRNMTMQNVRAIVQWAIEAGAADVALLGGEPSLHPHIDEILQQTRVLGMPSVRFITNGSRPFQRLFRSRAREAIDIVYVSLDGATAQTNDAVRGRGSFEQAIITLQMLAASGVSFVVTSTITQATLGEFEELAALAEASGCERLNIHWVSPTGRAAGTPQLADPQSWLDYCARAAKYEPHRSSLSVQCQPAFQADARADLELDIGRCAVREVTNLQFMPDGSVYGCGLLVDRPGLNGYEWIDGSLYAKDYGVPSELALCAEPSMGCPIRLGVFPELAINDPRYIPLCIYERTNNAIH